MPHRNRRLAAKSGRSMSIGSLKAKSESGGAQQPSAAAQLGAHSAK
jgi:hypothetical protein